MDALSVFIPDTVSTARWESIGAGRCLYLRYRQTPGFFQKRKESILTNGQKTKMSCVGNYDFSMQCFLATNPTFDGFEEFLEHLKKHCKSI